MTTLPNYRRAEATAAALDLALMRDIIGGTRPMHAASRTYIRKWPDESVETYDFRREIETVFEGTARTLSAATGMLFAKPPSLTWNASEERMALIWSNVDNAGTAGPVLVKRFAESSLRDGLGAILVDHPKVPDGGVDNEKIEQELGLRPTWAIYSRSQLINWRTSVINNRRTMTMAVLYEVGEVEDGLFGMKTVHRWRVLRLLPATNGGYAAAWTLYEADKADASKVEEFRVAGSGYFRNRTGQIAPFIPLSIAYTGRTDAVMVATIPLLGVAWANLSHWQISTDLRYYRSLSAYPQPVVIGEIPDTTGPAGQLVPGKVRLGPGTIVNIKGEGASFKWEELEGKSMEQLENGIREKLSQMSMLGVSFLAGDKRAAETAEAKRLDATAENSTLATAAQGIEDAINMALEHTAWYLGIEKQDAPVLTINRDFDANVMDPAVMMAWATVCEKTGMPFRQLLEAFQREGRIPPDANLDDIEAEAATNLEAVRQQKEQAKRDAVALQDPALAA